MVVLRIVRRRVGSGGCGGGDREAGGRGGAATVVLCPRGWHQFRVTFKVGARPY